MGEVGSGTLGDRYAMFNDAQVLAVLLFASYLFSGRVACVPVGLQQRVRPQVETMKDYLIELTDESGPNTSRWLTCCGSMNRGQRNCEDLCRVQLGQAARADARLRLDCRREVATPGRVHARWAGV